MSEAAALMDRMYRRQRHIYDASRKFYLLGRDRMIEALAPPPGGAVLEIGCGTGRNLIAMARRYPQASLFGLDVSAAMLETAAAAVARAGLSGRIVLAQADATDFDPKTLFGRAVFDRIAISYALSMIPPWRAVLDRAVPLLAPGGALHIVDFGDQAGLPGPFKALLRGWLGLFSVTPRDDLARAMATVAAGAGCASRMTSLHRGYAVVAEIRRPG